MLFSDDRVSNEHLRPRITDEHIGRLFCSQFACTQLYVCKHARADVFVYAGTYVCFQWRLLWMGYFVDICMDVAVYTCI